MGAVSNTVVARNSFGQFISEVEAAAQLTMDEVAKRGEELSKGFAPIGGKVDPRTPPLHAAFYRRSTRTSAVWGNFARHALPIETGAAPHVILGNPALSFYWEKAGRRWIPASIFYNQPGLVDVINHPGNPAQPYLRPAYDIVMAEVMDIARKYYPG